MHAYSGTQDIYEEVESRLHPQRQFNRGRAKDLVTVAASEQKQTSRPQARAVTDAHKHTYRTRSRRDRDENPHTPQQSKPYIGDTDTSGDEDYDSDGEVIKAGTKRKTKSILRPKGSKFSKKNNRRRQSLSAIVDDGEATSAAEDGLPQPSPLAAVAPREPPREPPRDSTYPYYLPRKVTEVKMVSYDIPTDQPQGPGDLWTCNFQNCNHRVHQASKPKGKAQIKEHFQNHARQAQEKIDLALSESRPYLPVR